MILLVFTETTSTNLELLAVGRVLSVKGASTRTFARNRSGEETVVVLRAVQLPSTAVTGLAKVGVSKAEPSGNRAAMTTLEGSVLETMLGTSSATFTHKL